MVGYWFIKIVEMFGAMRGGPPWAAAQAQSSGNYAGGTWASLNSSFIYLFQGYR
jgi:hypothetical protein